jgi:hypothetical protein
LIPVAIAYIVWRFWRNRETLPWAAAGLVAAGLLTAAIQIRNIMYTGSWKGGFTSGKHLPVSAAFSGTIKAFFHMVFGDRVPARLDIWVVLFVASLLVVSISIFRVLRSGRRIPNVEALTAILLLAVVYTGGVLATSLTSIAADFGRYYLPLYPLKLAVVAAICSLLPTSKVQSAALAVLVLAVLVIQARSLLVPLPAAFNVVARQELDEEVQPGISAKKWLQDHVPSNDVLISVNGQAVHYVLQLPVISVIPPDVSTRANDEAAFRSLLTQWHARYLVLFPGEQIAEQEEIPFLKTLAAGTAPDWLTLAARAPQVAIYECGTCSK